MEVWLRVIESGEPGMVGRDIRYYTTFITMQII